MAAVDELEACAELSAMESLENQIRELDICERNAKKLALDRLRKTCRQIIDDGDNSGRTAELTAILKASVAHLRDPQERCRETALTILQDLLVRDELINEVVTYVIPALVQRLTALPPAFEPSEEVRLELLCLLETIVERCSSSDGSGEPVRVASLGPPQIESVVAILVHALVDPYPEIKKVACRCAVKVATKASRLFYQHSEALVEPMLQSCLTHQHSKVRIATIHALGAVIRHGASKSLETTYNHLAQRMLDPVPQVRIAVAQVAGEWLLSLPDRYSYFAFLIPLVISSTSDDFPDVKDLGLRLWDEIGTQYELENEAELKEQLDITRPVVEGYPANETRPTLGCRILVVRHLSAILPALIKDLSDWLEPVRIRAAQLLRRLLINAEEGMAHQVPRLLDGLALGARDSCGQVVCEIVKSAELVGLFVSSAVWWPIVSAKMEDNLPTGSDLMILSGLIGGCRESDLRAKIEDIGLVLSRTILCHDREKEHQIQLLACIRRIIQKEECCAQIIYEVFRVLVALLALMDEDCEDDVNNLLLNLTRIANVQSGVELFSRFSDRLLAELKDSGVQSWTSSNEEWHILNTILLKLGPHNAAFLEEVLPILVDISKSEKDTKMRFHCLKILSHLVCKLKDEPDKPDAFIVTAIQDIVLPNTVWHPGKSASALRAAAISCLWLTLTSAQLDSTKVSPILSDLVDRTQAGLTDQDWTTRLMSCRILDWVCSRHADLLAGHTYVAVSGELLKRMDDAAREVRVTAAKCVGSYLTTWLRCDAYEPETYRRHLQSACQTLLVALDDADVELRDAALAVLESVALLQPAILKVEVDQVKTKHRNQYHVSKLEQFVNEIVK